MKLIAAFFRLVRWPNLLFIMLTQGIFYYSILLPVFHKAHAVFPVNPKDILLLILASVVIAAAGYIINDYFDINIDEVNKPYRLIVDHIISRRWAMLWHSLFSMAGVVISFYISWKYAAWWLGFANFGCTLLLFFYSTTLKKKLLWGNVLISLLTAWVISILGFLVLDVVNDYKEILPVLDWKKIFRLTIVYTSFAFIISLIREVVKDMEDMEGDIKYGCRTMPLVWGVNVSKLFVSVWILVLLALLIIIEVYAVLLGWWVFVLYGLFFIILPVGWVIYELIRARTSKEFHSVSSWVKLVMFTGILSMFFFRYYI